MLFPRRCMRRKSKRLLRKVYPSGLRSFYIPLLHVRINKVACIAVEKLMSHQRAEALRMSFFPEIAATITMWHFCVDNIISVLYIQQKRLNSEAISKNFTVVQLHSIKPLTQSGNVVEKKAKACA